MVEAANPGREETRTVQEVMEDRRLEREIYEKCWRIAS
jgi:hypothetical protein